MSHCSNLYTSVIECHLLSIVAEWQITTHVRNHLNIAHTLFFFVCLNEVPTAVMRFGMT